MGRVSKKKRVEQKTVLITLEDEKSSRYYFQALLKYKGLSGEVAIARHRGTNPTQVLKNLEKHKVENQKKKKPTVYEKEWIVIDRDRFPDFMETIREAKKNNICVAFSNESYELWILLHFKLIHVYTDRKNLNTQLNKIFKEKFGVEYSKSSQDIYRLIIGLQEVAIKNARVLVAHHLGEYGKIDPEKNPITLIYQLVECLNSLYDKEKKCDCFPITDMKFVKSCILI